MYSIWRHLYTYARNHFMNFDFLFVLAHVFILYCLHGVCFQVRNWLFSLIGLRNPKDESAQSRRNLTHICVHSGFELERKTVFVSRTSVRIFVIMGLSCNCFYLSMPEMQGYYVYSKCYLVYRRVSGWVIKRKQNGLTANSLFLFLAFSLRFLELALTYRVASGEMRFLELAFLSLIIKITISSIVIGLKSSYFPLIHLSSCYRTVCYRTPCYRTVCYRTVQ